ncbi:MAG: Gfo/Idh/MocA family oxidoreductase [Candidatus Latescibacteria bacterium]|jgi:scyllo-inositol 2-dehydrogenase (NADP+)|nr:Gfo/Idh/MocA family oxidoreductase [Candidatus Latescibacterota bacterium]
MVGKTVNVGLVGYGLGGRVFHAPLVELSEGLRLSAICSRSEERRSQASDKHPGVDIYAEYDALLADPCIDLVILATPHDTHAPMAIQAMDAGKHLVTDKVMCLSEAEGVEMIEASMRNQVVLSVFQNRRWDGDFLTLQDLMEQQALGEIHTVESNITTFGGPHSGWRAWKAHGGGRTRDWGAHLVDQALQLFGPTVETVFADHQYRYPAGESDVESTCLCLLRFAGGVRVLIELGSAWAFPKPRFDVRGSSGQFRKYGVDPQEDALKMGVAGVPIPEDVGRYQLKIRAAEGGLRDAPVKPVCGAYRKYYDNIAGVLLDGADLLVRPVEALEAVRVIDAIVASAETGEVIRLTGERKETQ